MLEKAYLIRHGLTESNKRNIYAGRSKENLCQQGISGIIKAGRNLKGLGIQKIFTSPVQRAFQTASIIDIFLRVGVDVEKNFKEMKMGPWEGFSEKEVAEKFQNQWKIWNTTPSKLSISGRETLEKLECRALKGIKKISKKSDWASVLVVTHVALIRVLCIHYNGFRMDDYRDIDVPNGAVYLLDRSGKNGRVKRIL
jgi:alpha-ribazole phosphatase/probable phosphoglycerate mutase